MGVAYATLFGHFPLVYRSYFQYFVEIPFYREDFASFETCKNPILPNSHFIGRILYSIIRIATGNFPLATGILQIV